jgi:acyl-CoA synthetase (AMP-forming)/AMP-acid ligase II
MQTREEILATCRERLAAHKIPVTLREVPFLELNAAGKLLRAHA